MPVVPVVPPLGRWCRCPSAGGAGRVGARSLSSILRGDRERYVQMMGPWGRHSLLLAIIPVKAAGKSHYY